MSISTNSRSLLSLLLIYSLHATSAETELNESVFDVTNLKVIELSMNYATISYTSNDEHKLKISFTQKLNSGEKETCLGEIDYKNKKSRLEVFSKGDDQSKTDQCDVDRFITISLDSSNLEQLDISHTNSVVNIDTLSVDQLNFVSELNEVTVGSMRTKSAEMKAEESNIEIQEGYADTINLNGSESDMRFELLEVTAVNANWKEGKIDFHTLNATSADISNENGAIKIFNHSGQTLELDNKYGPVVVDNTHSGTIEVKNINGPIYITGTAENLTTRNSYGNTMLTQAGSEFKQIQSKSTNGDIVLKVPEASVCDASVYAMNSKIDPDSMKNKEICALQPKTGKIKLSATHGATQLQAVTGNADTQLTTEF